MFISWKTFTANPVATLCVGVECDKCGCTYYYELSRIGSGSGTAVYGLGQEGASEAAATNALGDLQDRLANEAELVACPKCHWISDELVEGFRYGHYRGLLTTGIFVAIVGIAISLICVWFLAMGPAADRDGIPYFLVGGTVASLAFWLTTLVLQRWLRSRIQPNRNFPLPPVVPPGTPPALLVDEKTGELLPAEFGSDRKLAEDGPVELQLGRHELPHVCCRCLGAPDPEHALQIPVQPAISLPIPLCAACAKAITRRRRKITFVTTIILFPLMLLGLWAARLEKEEFWIFFAVSVVLAPTFGGVASYLMERPVKVKIVDASRGIVRLQFQNPGYRQLIDLDVA